jgi:predicted regulator of Ras-like GTPase activity (Roadblock/LC7/MglB family)
VAGYAISERQARRLGRILGVLMRQTGAEAIIVADQGGNILAQVSEIDERRLQTFAALAAGAFSATRELAGLIGEAEFRSIYHRGAERGIYIHCHASTFLTLVILGRETTQGLARLYVEKADRHIAPILLSTLNQSASSAGARERFEFDDNSDAFPPPNGAGG